MCVQWFAQIFGLVILCLSVKWSRADEVSGESLQNITAFSLSLSSLLHSSFSRGIFVFLVSVRSSQHHAKVFLLLLLMMTEVF